MAALRQAVLLPSEGGKASRSPQARGGKGAALVDMVDMGLPVPPHFTVATSVSRAFIEHGNFPKRFYGQLKRNIQALEIQTGLSFGGFENPLLVSVRSGAQVSMPGMMDTILNVGINQTNVKALALTHGEIFAYSTYCRFLVQYGELVMGVPDLHLADFDTPTGYIRHAKTLRWLIKSGAGKSVPENPTEQLDEAIRAVIGSWSSPRAVAYRESHSLPNWWGTAVTVQAMVFGNLDPQSCTGVVFSSDVTTGAPGLYGEFLPQAQGEEVVSGTSTPLPIGQMAQWNAQAYADLERYVDLLTQKAGAIVDVEFTVQAGQLYVLQYRRATRTPLAAVTFAVHQVWDKKWNHQRAVTSVDPDEVKRLRSQEFDPNALLHSIDRLTATGFPASAGVVVGRVALSCASAQRMAASGHKVILVREDTSPDDLPGMLVASAIVTTRGGVTCHAAVVARGLGLSAVVGAQDLHIESLKEGTVLSVDGSTGKVYSGELPLQANPVLPKEANIFLRWYEIYSEPKPRIGFEYLDQRLSANKWISDFYICDAMVHASNGTYLSRKAQTLRAEVIARQAQSLSVYLLVAIAAEVRHAWDGRGWPSFSSSKCAQSVNLLESSFGYGSQSQRTRESCQARVVKLLNATDKLEEQIRFAKSAACLFGEGNWPKSYGGRLWAKIAQTLTDYLEGSIPGSIFVDRVFDLRHNGGRLFDKHPIFSESTREDWVVAQLDVKKHGSDLRTVYNGLSRTWDPSDDVCELYSAGQRGRLW